MKDYIPQDIENKWHKKWEEEGLYETDTEKAQDPFYNLMMFPYPSGKGLHIGHVYAFSGSDAYGRFQRLKGKDVFEPFGFDAFGIHSENYALKKDSHPKDLVEETTEHFKNQLDKAGLGLDWSHSVNTTKKEYYKWTQWLFLQLYKEGLAERKEAPVNWCPSCKTVLADEQVIQGQCERCDSEVEQKNLEQWFLKITDYAQELDENLEDIDWTPKVKKAQKNWIGKSRGAEIKFPLATSLNIAESDADNRRNSIEVFTTRPDTLYGATFMVIAPKHELVKKIISGETDLPEEKREQIEKYVEEVTNKTEQDRRQREKSGLDTGLKAKNPATGEEIPIWIGDFVLAHYGGGAVMAVPAHDQRDFEFAKHHNLPIREVVAPQKNAEKNAENRRKDSDNQQEFPRSSALEEAYEGEGVLVNSGEFNGMESEKAKEKITDEFGRSETTYKLRDWLISRQRYWGPPIPIVYCDKCGEVPVPEEDLPVELPYMEDFKPTGTEHAPLEANEDFVETTCPKCGGPAKRETHVSDNFLDSAWYFFRYPSTDYDDRPFDGDLTDKWLPVDMYIGGAEHSVLHLLYTRFITMALHDMDYIDFEEPFEKFRAHGLITKDGSKMSKSRGNVVNPDEYIENYGADCMRMYLLFLGPFAEGGDFSEDGISGVEKFLKRLWEKAQRVEDFENVEATDEIKTSLHQTIKKVEEDMDVLKYNTAIAALMEYMNELEDFGKYPRELVQPLVKMVAPFSPHIAEEIYREIWGNEESIFKSEWPKHKEELLTRDTFTLVVQINGDVRGQMEAEKGIEKEEAKKLALKDDNVQRHLKGEGIKKVIYVDDKLINFVTN